MIIHVVGEHNAMFKKMCRTSKEITRPICYILGVTVTGPTGPVQ